MEINEKTAGNQVFIAIEGDMYVEEAAEFRERMMEHLQEGRTHFEIDMGKLSYIDSSGLGVLVALQKRTVERGGSVTLKGIYGTVKELFELTRLNRVFEILP
jgi:anti-sigma B factor antagonist